MATIKMEPPRYVWAGEPVQIALSVQGASPGAEVDVEVKKTHGPGPPWNGSITMQMDGSGAGDVVLGDAILEAPGKYVLVATASDAEEDYFAADAKVVEVIT